MKISLEKLSKAISRYTREELAEKAKLAPNKYVLFLGSNVISKWIEDKVLSMQELLISSGILDEDLMVDLDNLKAMLADAYVHLGGYQQKLFYGETMTITDKDIDAIYNLAVSMQ